jgi:uncharacterized membrane protein YhaH (DUF805 family)
VVNNHAFYEGWFSLRGRRGRFSFFLAVLSYGGMSVGIFWLFSLFPMSQNTWNLLVISFSLAFIVIGYLVTSQRLRDIGLSPWLALLWIPIGLMSSEFHIAFTVAFYLVLQGVPSRPFETDASDQ